MESQSASVPSRLVQAAPLPFVASAVSGRDEVILLQLEIDPGSSGDPMARREVTPIAAPPGAKLEVIGS